MWCGSLVHPGTLLKTEVLDSLLPRIWTTDYQMTVGNIAAKGQFCEHPDSVGNYFFFKSLLIGQNMCFHFN